MTVEQRQLIREAVDLSILIYGGLDKVDAALRAEGCKHVKPLDHCAMQGVCFTRGEHAFVVFRGTVTATDWAVDAIFFPPCYWPLRHCGFGFGWRALREDVEGWIGRLESGLPLFLCGHSLGGALAHVAGLELAGQGRPIAHIITIGAPKFAWVGTAKHFNKQSANLAGRTLGEITLNLVNKHDLVARVPPRWIGFQDVGRPIQNEKDGQWRFTERVESLLPDLLFESADIEPTPAQPWMMSPTPSGRVVLPGLATSVPEDSQGFKKFRHSIYAVFPPSRAPVAYVLLIYFTIRAAMDHPSHFYRDGLFELNERPRYMIEPEPIPMSTKVTLGLVGVAMLGGLLWLLCLIVRLVIESAMRGNAAS